MGGDDPNISILDSSRGEKRRFIPEDEVEEDDFGINALDLKAQNDLKKIFKVSDILDQV